jgi:hypothetical protein
MTITRQEVYAALDTELDYQLAMSVKAHGDPAEEGRKKLEQFVLYMDDYLRELKTQLSRTWGPDAYKLSLDTLRKVTAIGVAAMAVHGAPHRTSPTKHAAGTDLT